MPGAQCTRSLACEMKKHTSKSPQVHQDCPAFPHAMVLTVSFVLSPVIGFLVTVIGGLRLCQPGWIDKNLRQLDASAGASGPHDFAVRDMHLSSTRADRSQVAACPAITSRAQRCRVHRIPSRVRDDHDTPLVGQDMRDLEVIWVRREAKHFCKWGWTREPQGCPLICPSGKIS